MCFGIFLLIFVTYFIDFDRFSEEVFFRDFLDFLFLENGTGINDEDELSLGLFIEFKRKK